MSEAQSYQAGNIDKDRVVYLASDFDNVTRLFLDAAERCIASERREKELQQRLTAADERADVLEGLLREVVGSCALIFQDHDATDETMDLHERAESALKHASARASVKLRSDGTLSNDIPAGQSGHIAIGNLDYGSLDAAQRLALCRGEPVPAVTGSTCNQIREEAGQPISRPCKACGGGACIDR